MTQWTSARLADITSKIGSGATPLGGEQAYKDKGIALIRSMNVHDGEFRWRDLAFLDQGQADRLSNVSVERSDVLLNITGASIARCCVVPTEALPARVNQHVSILRAHQHVVLPQFLQYQLISPDTKARLINVGEGAGSTRQALTKAQLQDLAIRFPASLDEQRRIVTLLDEAFEGIATAKAHAELNLRNASELFARMSASLLAGVASESTNWELEALVTGDCSLSYGIVQPGDEFPGGLPIVRPVDLNDGIVTLDGLKRIDPALASSYERTTLRGNDILLCVRGSTGTMAMADNALAGANVTRGIVPIRFDASKLSQEIGYWLMRSEPVQQQIRAKTYGTALMQINIRDLRQLQVPVPPLSAQPGLVQAFADLESHTSELAGIYQRKLTALAELKQSLLHQAFTGQL